MQKVALPTQIHWVQHDRCLWISVFFIHCENYVLSWWLPTAKWWAVGHTWWTLLLRIRPSVQPNHGCPSVQSKAWFSTCIFIKKTRNTAMTRSAARAKGSAISTPGKERGQGWCVNESKCTRETVTDDGDKSKRDAWYLGEIPWHWHWEWQSEERVGIWAWNSMLDKGSRKCSVYITKTYDSAGKK